MRKRDMEFKMNQMERQIIVLECKVKELEEKASKRYLSDATIRNKEESIIPSDILNEYLFGESKNDSRE